jgi:hypothetical protein
MKLHTQCDLGVFLLVGVGGVGRLRIREDAGMKRAFGSWGTVPRP